MAILLVFLVTAALVKVEMDALSFFVITMIKIVLINCNRGMERDRQPWAWVEIRVEIGVGVVVQVKAPWEALTVSPC